MARKNRKKKEEVDFSQIAETIIEESVTKFIEKNYLPYANYSIQDRALISVDGLKPVQRRVLQTMLNRGLMPNKPHAKGSFIAGETMGILHPHGNVSIEDAMGRMGQDYIMRVPLVDIHGATGTEAGDQMPAARYWEARLSKAGEELVKELKDKAVPMYPNFDGTVEEAAVLPARWPSGIVNGSQGIAVGYASNMPPHNPTEVMDAAIALIENPDLTVDELLEIMPGPDFPTYGEITGVEGIKQYYETGKGTFTIRGDYEIKPLPRGRHLIEFTSLPYQVAPEKVFSDIKKAKEKGELKEISEYRNLAENKQQLVAIYVKAGSNINKVMQSLFRHTALQARFAANMTVLDDSTPVQMGMIELLNQFITFRRGVVVNKLTNRLSIIDKRVERLDGLIKVVDVDLDKAIDIIRNSDTAADAADALMKQFKIKEEQAEYILSMPLRRLTKSDTAEMKAEMKDLKAEVKRIEKTLGSSDLLYQEVINELEETKEIIADDRRSDIINKSAEALAKERKEARKAIRAGSKNEEITITLFENGLICADTKPFKQARARLPITSETQSMSQGELVVFMKDGMAHKIPAAYVNSTKPADVNMLGLEPSKIVGIGNFEPMKNDYGVLIATSNGGVNIIGGGYPVSLTEFEAVKLDEGEEVILAQQITKKDFEENRILMASSNGYVVHFKLDEIRSSNSGAGTVRGMALDDDAYVVGASVFKDKGEIVSCSHMTIKVTDIDEIPSRKRGAKGLVLQQLDKEDELINAFASEKVVAMKGKRGIRLPDATPRAAKGEDRAGTGVILGHD